MRRCCQLPGLRASGSSTGSWAAAGRGRLAAPPRAAAAAAAAASASGLAPPPPRRSAALRVECAKQASGGRRSARGASTRKGFAKPAAKALEEAWEADLPPFYKAYYRAGFKPPRYLGPIELRKNPDGTVDLATIEDVIVSQLLVVAPALVFLEGAFGSAPGVEALHAALAARGAGAPAGVARVLHLLPRAPAEAAGDGGGGGGGEGGGGGGGEAPAVSRMDGGAAADAAERPDQQQQLPPQAPSPLAAANDIFDLDPRSWSLRADTRQLPPSAPPPDLPAGDDLISILSASSYSEEHLDPAASQLRHELPVGFIGVWPELAAMHHSCAPNTAVAVLGGGHAFVHAARDLAPGEALTTNKIGGAILAPLEVRQAAVRALTGRPCGCDRCGREAALPESARGLLAALQGRVEGEWAAALEAAAAGGDEGALAALWEDVTLDVDALTDALSEAGASGADADALAAGAYGAAELAWTLEELTQPLPSPARLAAAVRMLRAVAPGSESHIAAALQLNELSSARVADLLRGQAARRQRTSAAERRLLAKAVKANEDAESALVAFYEAMYIRYGFIPEEGLLPQLQSGLQMFYAGLDQMATASAAGGAAASDAPRERDLVVDGIPVTLVDRVGLPTQGQQQGGGGGGGGSGGGRGALRFEVVAADGGADADGGGEPGIDEGEGEAGDGAGAGALAGGEGSLHEDGPLLLGEEAEDASPEALLAP
ncbi:hypothetical protein Rsub_07075 [Raphidocelis subcapitata]|uniref:SET domain-containing protein n=1 Tax=Raphidocelis subcapitata TaxID=307507 RepID=A0A2V0P3U0_9CHLO|nr:hypothetical protein Rsub_07075 [Raphidocelis subcapitata]|eukprot:GBF94541.1 hypothetical protein Rsub_07075 [Raphidocelis subcapitata]